MSIQIALNDSNLPPELENMIFEIAALARPKQIPTLMLVARRVKCWVEPLLYRVVLLKSRYDHEAYDQVGLPALSMDVLDQTSFNGFRHVRHLFIGGIFEETVVKSWLLACPGTTNLYAEFDLTPEILACLNDFRNLQYLTIEVHALHDNNVSLPFLHTVTHLELLNSDADNISGVCRNLSLMPHLTHIALNSDPDSRLTHAALCDNVQLQCIVFLSTPVPLNGPLLDDSRFVCVDETVVYYVDWLYGAVSGDDYWALADAFLAARRAGKTDRGRYRIWNGGGCDYETQ
ncbi:hypothetical protein C8R45DRAFT_1031331 [Mycena sanguinolenta]|nr:hypothetical protein C8R45DRAFT_1031331 [Mycena sanguinolenta]